MSETSPFFAYQATSYGFLERALAHLERFDEEDEASSLFYAAFELRMGIEARLWEYLKPALKELGKEPSEVEEYVATKLLRRLTELNPDAEAHTIFRITDEQDGASTVMEYTPVSRELASLHGRLGEILHFNFFIRNQRWFMRRALKAKGHRSLVDYRELLAHTVAELQKATTGTLLNNPWFTRFVDDVLEEAGEGEEQ